MLLSNYECKMAYQEGIKSNNMTPGAFLLVNVRADAISHPAEEMKQIPGISRVEEVSGVYDFIVELGATAHFTQISDLLMANPWVKRVHVLRPIR